MNSQNPKNHQNGNCARGFVGSTQQIRWALHKLLIYNSLATTADWLRTGLTVVRVVLLTPGVVLTQHRKNQDYRRASAQRLVEYSTATTALRSALSRISAVPVSNCASRPPSPCTATSPNLRSNASMIWAPSSATELSASSSSRQIGRASCRERV